MRLTEGRLVPAAGREQVLVADLAERLPGFLAPQKVRGGAVGRVVFGMDIMTGGAGQFAGRGHRHVGRHRNVSGADINRMHVTFVKEVLMAAGGAKKGDGRDHSARRRPRGAIRQVA